MMELILSILLLLSLFAESAVAAGCSCPSAAFLDLGSFCSGCIAGCDGDALCCTGAGCICETACQSSGNTCDHWLGGWVYKEMKVYVEGWGWLTNKGCCHPSCESYFSDCLECADCSCPQAVLDPYYGKLEEHEIEKPEPETEDQVPLDPTPSQDPILTDAPEDYFGFGRGVDVDALSGGGIAGIILMILVLHAALLGFLFYKKQKESKNEEPREVEAPAETEDAPKKLDALLRCVVEILIIAR